MESERISTLNSTEDEVNRAVGVVSLFIAAGLGREPVTVDLPEPPSSTETEERFHWAAQAVEIIADRLEKHYGLTETQRKEITKPFNPTDDLEHEIPRRVKQVICEIAAAHRPKETR